MANILDRDAGFCSGGDEDEMEAVDEIHSPTDASEDSVDVKVQAISIRNRNKRKCSEPRKVDSDLPAKKRKVDPSVKKGAMESTNCNPFRPWSVSPMNHGEKSVPYRNRINFTLKEKEGARTKELDFEKIESDVNSVSGDRLPSKRSTAGQRLIPMNLVDSHLFDSHHQEEPLSLVSRKRDTSEGVKVPNYCNPLIPKGENSTNNVPEVRLPLTSPEWYTPPSEICHRLTKFSNNGLNNEGIYSQNRGKMLNGDKSNFVKKIKTELKTKTEDVSQKTDNKFRIDSLLSSMGTEGSSGASTSKSSQGGQQRNYKNMTRERRIEANARERTRVHTISAAFDTLRHSIPAYSYNQKLSKLSVLRIACSYIMTLSRLAGYDYSKDQSEPDLSNCVEKVSKTIQTEGKIRKKRED